LAGFAVQQLLTTITAQPPAPSVKLSLPAYADVAYRFGNGLEMFEAQFKRHFRLPESWKAPGDPEKAYKLFRSFFYITHMQQVS